MNYSLYPSFTPKEVKTSGATPRTLWEPDPFTMISDQIDFVAPVQ